MKRLRTTACLAVAMVLGGLSASTALGWSHQGHILITRVAALRIIQDPQAPEGLKTFLKTHMKYDLAACERLVTGETVGIDAENYLAGLDGASTWPDRAIGAEGGKDEIAPYGAPEAKMHFLDMEDFCKDPNYKDDLSNTPAFADLPRDVKDPRYKRSGFVVFRVDEMYGNLVRAFAKPQENGDKDALKWAGCLAHYLEDSTQPQHGTTDYKSLSYLVGKVKHIETVTKEVAGEGKVTTYRVDRDWSRKINPHGDVEYQLFEDTEEPRKTLRAEFWKEFTGAIAAIDAGKLSSVEVPAPAEGQGVNRNIDGFRWSFELVKQGHAYLPLIGHAAAKAYSEEGKFDPQAFFTFEDNAGTPPEKMTVLRMIAVQNARAVIAVEKAYRKAWQEAGK